MMTMIMTMVSTGVTAQRQNLHLDYKLGATLFEEWDRLWILARMQKKASILGAREGDQTMQIIQNRGDKLAGYRRAV